MIWVEICISGCKKLCICAFYNPHEGNELSCTNFCKSLSNLRNCNSHVWVTGDFNLPGYDWKANCLKPDCHYPDLTSRYIEAMDDCSLTQIVKEPTRGDNTLHLFATNKPTLIEKINVIPGISDHDIVYVEGDINAILHKQQHRKIFLYKKADWDGLRSHMAAEATALLQQSSEDPTPTVNELWMRFKNKLQPAVDKFIPFKMSRSRNKLPYVDCKLRRLMRKRDKLHRKGDQRYKV
ncbi:uncharacterized protein LOC114576102, partial [Exaiptasia diaphana]|uniref:Endonuclease/exonuclease/phosphatase domain-containing protein n=1 Tax=Exaiptasia diaphana TaxID=2652724 RepID=A0A913YVA9_EXADI